MIKIQDLNLKEIDKKTGFCLVAILLAFVFSLLLFLVNYPGKRYNFYFESVDTGKICYETRFLQHKKFEESVKSYVDELLLGPKTERLRPLFSPNTKESFCFIKKDTLYVNITSDSLRMTGNASDILKGTELFKKNILKTFGKINNVEIYIDNKSIYKY